MTITEEASAGRADLWRAADLVGAAARAQWPTAAQERLLAGVAHTVAAGRAELWMSGHGVEWAADLGDGDGGAHVLEFSGESSSGASVLLLLGCAAPAGGAEEFVDMVGHLLVYALGHAGQVSDAMLRAEILRCTIDGQVVRHHAAGLLAERLKSPIAEGDRRVVAAAARFGLPVSVLARHLLDADHSVR